MIGNRKLEHVKIAVNREVESRTKNGFQDIDLAHRALPEMDMKHAMPEANFLGREIAAPIVIAGMTGGHKKVKDINKNLARAAQEMRIPMGVGSQRAAIENPKLEHTYSIAREVAPDVFLIANLGAVQFAKGYGLAEAKKAVEMLRADAIAIHLNPLHEATQLEGDTNFGGCIESIEKLKDLGVPIIAKETGAGIAREEALALEKAGVACIDVGGLGGTSFAAVEYYRGGRHGEMLWDWGIPTAISTIECLESTHLPVIATGGIRNGLEVAKALALGASACGAGLPFLKKAVRSHNEVAAEIKRFTDELKAAMFLTGSRKIEDLRKCDIIIRGATREWLELRGIDCAKYANRRRA